MMSFTNNNVSDVDIRNRLRLFGSMKNVRDGTLCCATSLLTCHLVRWIEAISPLMHLISSPHTFPSSPSESPSLYTISRLGSLRFRRPNSQRRSWFIATWMNIQALTAPLNSLEAYYASHRFAPFLDVEASKWHSIELRANL